PCELSRARATTDSARPGRTVTMPSESPPQDYLDAAVMAGVSLDQARGTWSHYWGAGLPDRGVEKLHPWLVKRAKERANQVARTGPHRRDVPNQPNAGVTGLEKAIEY